MVVTEQLQIFGRPPIRVKRLSRGHLVGRYLEGSAPPEEYLRNVAAKAGGYNGFNLLIGDETNLFYFSNRRQGIDKLSPGVYVLSNHFLNTSWPKLIWRYQNSRRSFYIRIK